jgi:Ser/Thr protein kinase RdoA (MazF antagonist)
LEPLWTAADRFKPRGRILDIRPFGSGNVHDTFLVTLDDLTEKKFILQRLNTRVFRQPGLIMQNIKTFTDHIQNHRKFLSAKTDRRWEVPRLLLTEEGRDHLIDAEGSFWRAFSFIDHARTFDTIQGIDHAREVGYALARFHGLINDLPVDRLADTLKGFHITPGYLEHYDRVLAKGHPKKSPEAAFGLRFIRERRNRASVLEDARNQGRLHVHPIHGDPKVNNVLIEMDSWQAVGLVDLDTIKPGLVLYDISDCLRSCCNPLGEDTEQWETVRFDTDFCRAIIQGYLPEAGEFLEEGDYEYLVDAVRLIAFELGLRFFTDYLEGNVYFKVGYETQNLYRALVQFRLAESIESKSEEIQALVRDMR